MSRPETMIGGRYRLVSPIATGGMGSVWEAWDERLQRRVAVKQLHPQPGLSADDARIAGERALREARNAARLHHPHAVPVYDVVDHEGQPCLVMQYLPTKSLQALLAERGTLDVAQVARIGSEVASALEAAHQVGIVHRDVKPGNVLIDAEGQALLTDFGISHSLGDPSLTATGLVTGTPAFLAPEVARGATATPASDVFSLGSMLYTALEGTSPFGDGQNAMATLHRAASGQIAPPRRSGPLTPVLERMLAVDPAARPSMAEVAHSLREAHRAALDPAAFARTQQLTPPPRPAAGPPPSSTVVLPPVGPPPAARPPAGPPPDRRRRRGPLIAALIIAALILGGLVALLVNQAGDDGGSATGSRTTPAQATKPTTSPKRRTSSARSSAASRPTTPTTSPSSPPSTSASSSAAGGGGGGGGATAGDPAEAVTSYYALLPDDTDTAWSRLTKKYQKEAGGRDGYEQFWGSIDAVQVSGARTTGPDTAQATIRYSQADGSTSSEVRTFTFKKQGGALKIDASEVVG